MKEASRGKAHRPIGIEYAGDFCRRPWPSKAVDLRILLIPGADMKVNWK